MTAATPPGRTAIVDAAADLIRLHGVAGMSISDVVQRSGTSAGAVYHHFANRQAIVVEVARQTIAWPLAAITTGEGPKASPARLLTQALDTLQAFPEAGELLLQLGAAAGTDGELGAQLRVEFARFRDAVADELGAWALENGLDESVAHAQTQVLIGLALGQVVQGSLVQGFDADSFRQQALALVEQA